MSDPAAVEQGFAAGADDYAPKPFRIPELLARIRNRLRISEMERQVRESEERFRFIVEGTRGVLFYICDAQRRFRYVSPSVGPMLGYPEAEVVGREYGFLFSEPEPDTWAGAGAGRTLLAHHSEGYSILVEVDEREVERSGGADGFQGLARDVTEQVRSTETLRAAALHDPLTGLPNRLLFLERLNQAVKRLARQPGNRVAVLFLDLDRFKQVNDTFGHDAGDELLRVVARRLCGSLRPEDTVARFGGDEFALVIEGVQDPLLVHQLVHRIEAAIAAPIPLRDQEIVTRASIGVAIGDSAEIEAADLLRHADLDMYRVKAESGWRE
ncbi:MAG TPA: diguanylate cyclase [Longimicrobiaceae bacterium]|nr:diguanylate cyclase [Longimicrobiaceae bacterium]